MSAGLSLIFSARDGESTLGCSVALDGRVVARSEQPLCIQVFDGSSFRWVRSGYQRTAPTGEGAAQGVVATGEIVLGDSHLLIRDSLVASAHSVTLTRVARVEGNSLSRQRATGFLTAVEWRIEGASFRDRWFIPGVWYQQNLHAPPYAIGSPQGRGQGRALAFREDRLPLPLVMHWDEASRTSVTLLHLGATPATVAADDDDAPLVDARLGFGAFDVSGGAQVSWWFPGTEGQTLYPPMWSLARGNSQADSTVNPFAGKRTQPQWEGWSYRYHPLADGFTQSSTIELSVRTEESYAAARDHAWRHAAALYHPAARPQDLARVDSACRQLLGRLCRRVGDASGIPTWVDCFTGKPGKLQNTFGIGFVARNLEAADILMESGRQDLGADVLDFWTTRGGDGLSHTEYDPALRVWVDSGPGPDGSTVYLRDESEAHRSCLRAWLREKKRGNDHPRWLEWAQSYGDWLIRNQQKDGSFARAYSISGQPVSPTSAEGMHAATFLLELARCAGDERHGRAAIRLARHLWKAFHEHGEYFGATLDNPDCYDKEAAALAMEGYLMLFEATGDRAWLSASEQAARVCETWVFLWDIPMPVDDLHDRFFPSGGATTGYQLITSGFSAFDVYLTRHVGDFARLARLTGDDHYRELARILLHNTKSTIQLDNEYGYAFPGFQIEHWSAGRGRGYGLNSGWLPWVATSHVLSIQAAREEMPEELLTSSASA